EWGKVEKPRVPAVLRFLVTVRTSVDEGDAHCLACEQILATSRLFREQHAKLDQRQVGVVLRKPRLGNVHCGQLASVSLEQLRDRRCRKCDCRRRLAAGCGFAAYGDAMLH